MKLEKELIYNQPNVDIDIGFHEAIKIADENLKLLRNLDKNAQAKYPILGGCFSTSVADGKVFYQVVEVSKARATVRLCNGICLDEYVDDILGYESTISLSKATELVERERALLKLFGGAK